MAHSKTYHEAEKKIEDARQSGATKLDLSYQFGKSDYEKLTELPMTLWQLTKLKYLNLSFNLLTAIPESVGQLTDLQELDLSNNQLTIMPETIGQLNNLQILNLCQNQLIELPSQIGKLSALKQLYLGWVPDVNIHGGKERKANKLTELPEEIGQLAKLSHLGLSDNKLKRLPSSIGMLKNLEYLNLAHNPLVALPSEIGQLSNIRELNLTNSLVEALPSEVRQLTRMTVLALGGTCLKTIPFESISQLPRLQELYLWSLAIDKLSDKVSHLTNLKTLSLHNNNLTSVPSFIVELENLENLDLKNNPLNFELASAYEEGLDAVKAYLRAKAGVQITLNEAKLILVGEGEVGKTCLMDALEGVPWQEHRTTHGIEIRTITTVDPHSGTKITLNGWDFGGQRVYRPTHQLFFSSPAVYLVVWKPREGPQQGFVKEWIKLVKHREPDAKVLVVATHGGPQQRQPDIDRQELRDLFGKNTVLDFFHVDSKPDENGQRRGIEELKQAIVHIAANLPEMGREVPENFQKTRQALAETDAAYLPLGEVQAICYEHGMEKQLAKLFVAISHRLGHLIHYEHDPALRDIVILKPDWLTIAISFVLDDEEIRQNYGLVSFERLSHLWNDPTRKKEERYEADLHHIFLRLMERFDLSYRVAGLSLDEEHNPVSLIAQLVPDNRPRNSLQTQWVQHKLSGDSEQVQICQIVDERNGQSANAEGLFYQLIVRLHRYSLGRTNYHNSVHWQRGLVLDHEYNGRALLEHQGNDIRITVRAPYPERLLTMLTEEVRYLVESFWEGLRCNVMVPCITPCGKETPGIGLFEVEKLIDSKRKNRPEYPCAVCNEWQNIDLLLRNAPAVRPAAAKELIGNQELLQEMRGIRRLIITQHGESQERFDQLDAGQRELLSKADDAYESLMKALTDEAKEGPRLFSLMPVDRRNFNPKKWVTTQFRLTLWCEHSRKPLPLLNDPDNQAGVYEIELNREWFKKAAPYLKVLNVTLSLVLPVATSGFKLAVDDAAFDAIEEQLDFSTEIIDASLSGGGQVQEWLSGDSASLLEHGEGIRAQGASLRELHALLEEKDPGFGGLVRVRNKRQEFLWVHPQFEQEY